MNEAYWQGFINKCAELGVDPEELLKQARLGAALTGAVTSGAKGAWDVILRAIRKHVPEVARKGISRFGRGVVEPYKGLGRLMAGRGASLGDILPVPGLPASEIAGRATGMGAGGAGVAGLLSLLGGGEKAPEPAPSPMAGVSSQLKDWYEQLRSKVS